MKGDDDGVNDVIRHRDDEVGNSNEHTRIAEFKLHT